MHSRSADEEGLRQTCFVQRCSRRFEQADTLFVGQVEGLAHGAGLHAGLREADDVRLERGDVFSGERCQNLDHSPKSSLSWKNVGIGAHTPGFRTRLAECPLVIPFAADIVVDEIQPK